MERSPANPELLDSLGKPVWGIREAIVPLLSLCMLFYALVILLHGLGSPFWLCKLSRLAHVKIN